MEIEIKKIYTKYIRRKLYRHGTGQDKSDIQLLRLLVVYTIAYDVFVTGPRIKTRKTDVSCKTRENMRQEKVGWFQEKFLIEFNKDIFSNSVKCQLSGSSQLLCRKIEIHSSHYQ